MNALVFILFIFSYTEANPSVFKIGGVLSTNDSGLYFKNTIAVRYFDEFNSCQQ